MEEGMALNMLSTFTVNKMKKILMSVVGIGYGHATRSHAIYNELKSKARVKIFSYGAAQRYFKLMKIPCYDFGGYEYKGREYSFDVFAQILELFKNPTKIRKDYIKFRKMATDFKPDIVFSDSEPNSFFYASNRGIPIYTLTNLITTLNHYHILPPKLKTKNIVLQHILLKKLIKFMLSRGNLFFVPSFEKKVVYSEKIKYVDLIVRKKPNEVLQSKKIKEKLGVKSFYYVSIGGAEIEKHFFKILEKVLPEFDDKVFVISSNYIVSEVKKSKNMIIFPFVKNSLELIKASDGVISPAGHSTISECVVFRKPVLTVPIRNHVEQMVNAFLVKKEGYGEACVLDSRISKKSVYTSLSSFFDKQDEYLENLKKHKFKGDGAKEIAKTLIKQ